MRPLQKSEEGHRWYGKSLGALKFSANWIVCIKLIENYFHLLELPALKPGQTLPPHDEGNSVRGIEQRFTEINSLQVSLRR